MSNLGNLASKEGSVTAEETLTFDWRPRKIVVTNDSYNYDLKVKFNSSETYMTLKPTETFSAEITYRNIIIKSQDGIVSVPYRIWGLG